MPGFTTRMKGKVRIWSGFCFGSGLVAGMLLTWLELSMCRSDRTHINQLVLDEFPEVEQVSTLFEDPNTCFGILSREDFLSRARVSHVVSMYARHEEPVPDNTTRFVEFEGMRCRIDHFGALPDSVRRFAGIAEHNRVLSIAVPGRHRTYGQYYFIEVGESSGLLFFVTG